MPRWESKGFPTQQTDKLTLLVSGYSEDSGKALYINQKTRIYGAKLSKGTIIEHSINHQAYVLASNGIFNIEDVTGGKVKKITMNKGDGAEITQLQSILLRATTDCEIIIIDTID